MQRETVDRVSANDELRLQHLESKILVLAAFSNISLQSGFSGENQAQMF